MAKLQRKGKPAKGELALTLAVEHVPAPDAPERLRRAFQVVLKAAARAEAVKEASKGEAPQVPEGG